MRLIADVVIAGTQSPAMMAARLRAAADDIEAAVETMASVGSSPPSIDGGNDLVFTIPVRGTKV